MGYSVSGPNTYPSIGYTGCKPLDSPRQMTFTEQTAHAGLGSQTAATGGDRYGDYSHLPLDPDGKTFWHTAQYVAADGYPRTCIYSFKLATATGIADNPYYKNLTIKILNGERSVAINVEAGNCNI